MGQLFTLLRQLFFPTVTFDKTDTTANPSTQTDSLAQETNPLLVNNLENSAGNISNYLDDDSINSQHDLSFTYSPTPVLNTKPALDNSRTNSYRSSDTDTDLIATVELLLPKDADNSSENLNDTEPSSLIEFPDDEFQNHKDNSILPDENPDNSQHEIENVKEDLENTDVSPIFTGNQDHQIPELESYTQSDSQEIIENILDFNDEQEERECQKWFEAEENSEPHYVADTILIFSSENEEELQPNDTSRNLSLPLENLIHDHSVGDVSHNNLTHELLQDLLPSIMEEVTTMNSIGGKNHLDRVHVEEKVPLSSSIDFPLEQLNGLPVSQEDSCVPMSSSWYFKQVEEPKVVRLEEVIVTEADEDDKENVNVTQKSNLANLKSSPINALHAHVKCNIDSAIPEPRTLSATPEKDMKYLKVIGTEINQNSSLEVNANTIEVGSFSDEKLPADRKNHDSGHATESIDPVAKYTNTDNGFELVG